MFLVVNLTAMKKMIAAFASFLFLQANAQLTTPPDGGNKKASVTEKIGITDVTINYDRPGVKGREGKIWGTLVPYGFNDLGFGTSKAAPWRAGANESTNIEFSTDVKINGQPLPAGKYGFFIAVGKDKSTIIFSHNNTAWGSFFYNQAEDALRVDITQQQMDKLVERLKYEFMDETETSATIALEWEKWMFPFKVEVDLNATQLASFHKELQTNRGFDWKAYVQAVDWCVAHNTNLEEALKWADYGISGLFVGEKNFRTMAAKASVLKALNRNAEADAIMQEALPLGKANEVHAYARLLLANGQKAAAIKVFTDNYKNFPNTFTTNMGMVRAMNADGKPKEALKYAQAALPQAPDPANKAAVEGMIETFQKGELVK